MEAPETTEYAARMIELAEAGMRQTHDFERLQERVPAAPPGAAGGRGRRGVGSRRRGGRAGRGDEPTSEIPSSSYQPATINIPSTSYSRPSTSQTPLYMPGPFSDYVPWPSFPHPPVRDPQGERPVRDLQGRLQLHYDESMFEEFVFDTAPSQEAVDTQVHSSVPVDPSPAPGPTPETVEEPAQEPSHRASQEAVNTQVHSSAPVDPSPAPGPTLETVEEPAQEPSHRASQEAVDTQVHSSAPVDSSPASGPTPETVEEPAQEPSHRVHSPAPVDPSPAPGPTPETVEEPAQEPSPDEIDEEPCYEPAPPPTVISHRKHVMNRGPSRKKGRKGSKDDHAKEHVQIKRRKEDGDDGGGGGVSLRPSRTLKAPTCGT
ncbi:uncharacterized protein LOC132620136 [Lycium barbarum]|uniref:uncharacterized protein LOC132620136 n=1 Tax=Lycium barbarum TaxID=112863 RepID=UPI00293F2DB4|nr:uncharacterized protein LOC132620136 [Lycium barbarum]